MGAKKQIIRVQVHKGKVVTKTSVSAGPLPLSKSEESLGAGANTDDVSSGNHTGYML
jgi:hypothetical protein